MKDLDDFHGMLRLGVDTQDIHATRRQLLHLGGQIDMPGRLKLYAVEYKEGVVLAS